MNNVVPEAGLAVLPFPDNPEVRRSVGGPAFDTWEVLDG